MNRNVPSTESSLLLQFPKSVLSFSDMSGNSFLMPVAVENVVAPEKPLQDGSNSEKCREAPVIESTSVCQLQQPLMSRRGSSSVALQDGSNSAKCKEAPVIESTSVCQLQQPLMNRRGSSTAPKMSVPQSESNAQLSNVDLTQTDSFDSRQPSPASSALTSSSEDANSSTSVANLFAGQPIQSAPIFSGFQNQPPPMRPDLNPHLHSSQYMTLNHGYNGHQSIYPTQTANAPNNNAYNIPTTTVAFPSPFETNGDYSCVTSAADYLSQPPVITPSSVPTYYNHSSRNSPQVPQTALPSQSYDNQNLSMPPYTGVYRPIKPHWLFQEIVENKEIWKGFSIYDSDVLERTYQQDPNAIVHVEGGRFDALLKERIKRPVYFEGKDLKIRRCTWYYRADSIQRYEPFTEDIAQTLEQFYSSCMMFGRWHVQLELPGIGTAYFETPDVFLMTRYTDEDLLRVPHNRPTSSGSIKRGFPETLEMLPYESWQVDHLVFIVQGIGSVCDLKFRTVTECVDGFREIANKMLPSHFEQAIKKGEVGRVEFLPLAWHAKLHTSDKGFDRCMKNITLPSIPKLRHFTNDTLLDILLYSSPIYCQSIIDTVASELNKLYEIFIQRNPKFCGKVFVAGHSLGSLILFDILANQKTGYMSVPKEDHLFANPTASSSSEKSYDSITSLLEACHMEDYIQLFEKEKIDMASMVSLSNDDLKNLGIPTDLQKKLLNAINTNSQVNVPEDEDILSPNYQSKNLIFPHLRSPCMQSIIYPRLHFEPLGFFALGSPIAMFLTVRGYERISEDFRFPTCQNFFHIFHPYDPVAFRIEPLIDPNFNVKPVLIPHHKGRKRMHLEIRENLSKVGTELKQKVLDTLRQTWSSLSGFARAHTFPTAIVEAEVDKLVCQQISGSEYEQQATFEATPSEIFGEELQIGSLNGGRRIDFVLQEKPIEALNDYIFALTSHATYWDSEDTVLMMLKEIYATQGILASSQPTMERRLTQPLLSTSYSQSSMISNPGSFEGATGDLASTSAPLFYNQNAHASQILSNVPPPPVSSAQLSAVSAQYPTASAQYPAPSTTQPVGPPPLTGFVKKSPFAR